MATVLKKKIFLYVFSGQNWVYVLCQKVLSVKFAAARIRHFLAKLEGFVYLCLLGICIVPESEILQRPEYAIL